MMKQGILFTETKLLEQFGFKTADENESERHSVKNPNLMQYIKFGHGAEFRRIDALLATHDEATTAARQGF